MSPTELAFHRRICAEELVSSATVLKYAVGEPSPYGGGGNETYTDGPVYPCRVESYQSSRASQEGQVGGGIIDVTMLQIVFPWNADINHKDRIRVGTDEYEIMGSNNTESERFTIKVNVKLLE